MLGSLEALSLYTGEGLVLRAVRTCTVLVTRTGTEVRDRSRTSEDGHERGWGKDGIRLKVDKHAGGPEASPV
jgi:hypothetical protein